MNYNLEYLIKKPRQAIRRGLSIYHRSKEQTILSDTFIEQTYYPLVRLLKPNTNLLDIGASIGDTAIYFSQFREVEHVYAFECDRKIWERGAENVKLSPFSHKISFYNKKADAEAIKGYLVLGDIAIKCDIEGGEAELFEGLDMKQIYAVIMETHDTKEKMIKLLKDDGFEAEWRFMARGVRFKELGLLIGIKK
jgi:hypothetical protein